MEQAFAIKLKYCQEKDYNLEEDLWYGDFRELCSLLYLNRRLTSLKRTMLLFHRRLGASVELFIAQKEQLKLERLQLWTINFLYFSSYVHNYVSRQDLSRPNYSECVSAILAVYFDIIVNLKNDANDKAGAKFKGLVMYHHFLHQEYVYDLLLPGATLSLNGQNKTATKIFFAVAQHAVKCFVPRRRRTEPASYSKYVVAMRQLRKLYPTELAHETQGAFSLPAPDNFLSWVEERGGSSVMDDLPVTQGFQGLAITRFLLEEAEDQTIEALLDVLTADMGDDEEEEEEKPTPATGFAVERKPDDSSSSSFFIDTGDKSSKQLEKELGLGKRQLAKDEDEDEEDDVLIIEDDLELKLSEDEEDMDVDVKAIEEKQGSGNAVMGTEPARKKHQVMVNITRATLNGSSTPIGRVHLSKEPRTEGKTEEEEDDEQPPAKRAKVMKLLSSTPKAKGTPKATKGLDNDTAKPESASKQKSTPKISSDSGVETPTRRSRRISACSDAETPKSVRKSTRKGAKNNLKESETATTESDTVEEDGKEVVKEMRVEVDSVTNVSTPKSSKGSTTKPTPKSAAKASKTPKLSQDSDSETPTRRSRRTTACSDAETPKSVRKSTRKDAKNNLKESENASTESDTVVEDDEKDPVKAMRVEVDSVTDVCTPKSAKGSTTKTATPKSAAKAKKTPKLSQDSDSETPSRRSRRISACSDAETPKSAQKSTRKGSKNTPRLLKNAAESDTVEEDVEESVEAVRSKAETPTESAAKSKKRGRKSLAGESTVEQSPRTRRSLAATESPKTPTLSKRCLRSGCTSSHKCLVEEDG